MKFTPADKKLASYLLNGLNAVDSFKDLDMNDVLAIASGYKWFGGLIQRIDEDLQPPVIKPKKKVAKKKTSKKLATKKVTKDDGS
jgi:hypothetical protein